MRIGPGERELVIRYIVVTTLPKILERDSLRMQEIGLFNAYVRHNEKLLLIIEAEQREVRGLLRSSNIKILELETKGGISCQFTVRGYVEVINMPPSVIKAACDQHLQIVMGLS